LSEEERAAILEVLRSDRFADIAVPQVYTQLLDEGSHLCSQSTMYRLLRANAEVHERRAIARHPEYTKPELLATAPRQVLSWDITKVRGPQKGIWYSLLVMIDLFSRFVVGWCLVRRSNAKVAEHFVSEIAERESGNEPRGGSFYRSRRLPDRRCGSRVGRPPSEELLYLDRIQRGLAVGCRLGIHGNS